jgi:ribosome maturation factor RimP
MDPVEQIKKLTEAALVPGQFLVDVFVSSKKGPAKVLVLLDGDQGITIDDCAEVSRTLSKALDESPILTDNYTLEVSTPGVDHPLKLKRQYVKNIGRNLRIKLGDKAIEGKLTEVKEDLVILTQEIGTGKKKESVTVEVPFSGIDQAFVLVSFK